MFMDARSAARRRSITNARIGTGSCRPRCAARGGPDGAGAADRGAGSAAGGGDRVHLQRRRGRPPVIPGGADRVSACQANLVITETVAGPMERWARAASARRIRRQDPCVPSSGSCVWQDAEGNQSSRVSRLGTGGTVNGKATILGGTGKFAGITGGYDYELQFVASPGEGSANGRAQEGDVADRDRLTLPKIVHRAGRGSPDAARGGLRALRECVDDAGRWRSRLRRAQSRFPAAFFARAAQTALLGSGLFGPGQLQRVPGAWPAARAWRNWQTHQI